MEKIAITGYSGFIGSELKRALLSVGYQVIDVSRQTVLEGGEELDKCIRESIVFIHLSGSTIATRWTVIQRKRIRSSRIETTKAVVNAIIWNKPSGYTLICASGVNIYRNGTLSVESRYEEEAGFLPDLVRAWEHEAAQAITVGTRVIHIRLGAVLGREGGMYRKVRRISGLLGAAQLGNGRQAFPCIHISDLCSAVLHLIKNVHSVGVYNLVTPRSADNATFTRILADAIRRPVMVALPSWVIRLFLGEASQPLLKGPEVQPEKLLREGFEFRFPGIKEIIDNLENRNERN